MKHLDIRDASISAILSEGENVYITTLSLIERRCSHVLRISVQPDGRLRVQGSNLAVGLVEGPLLERSVSKEIEDHIKRTPLEWLIQEGSVETCMEIARIFGNRLDILTNTSKTVMWTKAFLEGFRLVCGIFNCELDQQRYDEAREVCRPGAGQ